MSAIQSFSKDLGQRQQEFIAISIFLFPTIFPDVIICLVTLFAKRHTAILQRTNPTLTVMTAEALVVSPWTTHLPTSVFRNHYSLL